jgi:hypothetical protein
MTATRRLAQANGGFLPTATSTVAKLPAVGPSGRPSATPRPSPPAPQARYLTCASTVSECQDKRDYAVREKVSPVRFEGGPVSPTRV